MARVRLSTTVDQELFVAARVAHGAGTDASVMKPALRALLAASRRVEVDEQDRHADQAHPIDDGDAWGDLASWRERAATPGLRGADRRSIANTGRT